MNKNSIMKKFLIIVSLNIILLIIVFYICDYLICIKDNKTDSRIKNFFEFYEDLKSSSNNFSNLRHYIPSKYHETGNDEYKGKSVRGGEVR